MENTKSRGSSAGSARAGRLAILIACGLLTMSVSGQPLRLAILGDSLSAEYDSITGIAGVDDPTEYAAVTVPGWESMSWVEVVGRLRSGAVSLGRHESDLLAWGLLRFSGYEFNFAIPGFEASHFEQIVNSSLFSDPQYLPYRRQLEDVLEDQADAAVVWLGSNEFRANYGSLYDGNDPTPLIEGLRSNLGEVLDFVRARHSGIKLVVVNLPDLGASPDKQAAHPDPLKRARVTAATIRANQMIADLAAARGIGVADVFAETRPLVAGETVWIGPVDMYPGRQADNHPRYQFTRDGLHPNTCLQAMIARRILGSLNQAYATAVPRITDREILDLVGLDPMQPYWDWAAVHALSARNPGDDPDGDGWANLVEFAFELNPLGNDAPPLGIRPSSPPIEVRYRPSPDRLRLVEVQPEWSLDLGLWQPVPESQRTTASDGTVTVSLPATPVARFVRLRVSVRATD